MEYVIVDMTWGSFLKDKKPFYQIKQLAAIALDEFVHTKDSFYRINEETNIYARQLLYMMDLDEACLMDMNTLWKDFMEWLPEDAFVFVWGAETKCVLDKLAWLKNSIRLKVVDLQDLQQLMLPDKYGHLSLKEAMVKFGLSYMDSFHSSLMYDTKCMVRLFRKLHKEAVGHMDEANWHKALKQMELLRKYEFFEQLKDKTLWKECRDEISDFCKAKGMDMAVNENRYTIRSSNADWKFDIRNMGGDLVYTPVRGLKVPHVDMQIKKHDLGLNMVVQEILERICKTEERLKYGVGSEVIVRALERVSERSL